MAIHTIFNGYYRSGTTLVWEILKTSNPSFRVFYEPLHPVLIRLIRNFQSRGDKDELHEKILWEEYTGEGEWFIQELAKNHKFQKKIFPSSTNELFRYLDVYNNLAQISILQTNRLHFHLNSVIGHYGIKAVQIIRNPMDVYHSLLRVYQNSGSRILKFLSFLKNRHSPKSNIFLIKKNMHYVYNEYKIPSYWGRKKLRSRILRDPFKTHVLSWILSNYFVMNSVRSHHIIPILYEDLINDPEKIQAVVEDHCGLKFEIRNIRRNKKIDLNQYKNSKLIDTISSLGLFKEYDQILKRSNLNERA